MMTLLFKKNDDRNGVPTQQVVAQLFFSKAGEGDGRLTWL